MAAGRIFIGTAGWSIPRASAHHFEAAGTHLQRYARLLRCAEINSSFHRPHATATYAKWAGSTPPGFRFAVKLPPSLSFDVRAAARFFDVLRERYIGSVVCEPRHQT